MEAIKHSVVLDRDKCKGCINCIKRCPTQAIRVRDGKANIISELCIDCGECIRVCPHKAKKANTDSLSVLDRFDYTVALPAPSLYAQFNNISDRGIVLNALLDFGFDDVYEVAYAAERITEATKRYLESDRVKSPVISSACPAVTRLIRIRYPSLIPNVLPLVAPVEYAAMEAKKQAMEKTGLPADRIGCIFISPCPAKVTAAYNPIALDAPVIDAAVSVRDIYPALLKIMKTAELESDRMEAGKAGLIWGRVGGESQGLDPSVKYLAADGIENVIRVLEDIEDDRYADLQFVEFAACSAGCVGGVLQVENPYIARAKLKKIMNDVSKEPVVDRESSVDTNWHRELRYDPVMELGSSMDERFDLYERIQEFLGHLPGLDCGCCGAPTCEAFAEDVVKGNATEDACIVVMRQKLEGILRSFNVKEAGNK